MVERAENNVDDPKRSMRWRGVPISDQALRSHKLRWQA
jgi:hypothetical protein